MCDLGLAKDCEAEDDDKLPWILNGLKALSRGITLVPVDESPLPCIEEGFWFVGVVGSGDAGVVADSSGDAGVSKLSSSSSLGDSGEAGVSSTSLDSEPGESGDDCQLGFLAVSDLSSFFGLLPPSMPPGLMVASN